MNNKCDVPKCPICKRFISVYPSKNENEWVCIRCCCIFEIKTNKKK